MIKTGTTIVGVVYDQGIIIAADSRATAGRIADKDCMKIHKITSNIVCCGAGTAADCKWVVRNTAASCKLQNLNNNSQMTLVQFLNRVAQHCFEYGGQVGANLIVAGIDSNGKHLAQVDHSGYIKWGSFLAMGSGGLAAITMLEKGYTENINLEQAKIICRDAIRAGQYEDLASGNTLNMAVITEQGINYITPYEKLYQKMKQPFNYKFNPGTIKIIRKEIIQNEEEMELE